MIIDLDRSLPLRLPFLHSLAVRYCETDRMGVAHHGSYVDWLEAARTEWLKANGASYRALEDDGHLLLVVEVAIRYVASVTYDDAIIVRTGLLDSSRATITVGYEVHRADDSRLVARGYSTLAAANRGGRPQRLPTVLQELIARS
jgi:acyl-CoA thioester hydrolase